MISGHISSVGVLAKPLLNGADGIVAYALRSTLYLKTRKGLFCLAANELPRGPVNLNCSITQFEFAATPANWQLKNGVLSIDDLYIFALSGVEIWSPNIPVFYPYRLVKKLAIIKSVLEQTQPQQNTFVEQEINRQLSTGATALKQWLYNPGGEIPEDLTKLIGCGNGLTPAGDDFLSGVLIALHYLQRRKERQVLQRRINDHSPGRTNDISLALLSAAGTGNPVEPVHDLMFEVCSNTDNAARISTLARTVVSIGHSSGWHILAGICTSLETTAGNKNREFINTT